jgi:hypothetical protein
MAASPDSSAYTPSPKPSCEWTLHGSAMVRTGIRFDVIGDKMHFRGYKRALAHVAQPTKALERTVDAARALDRDKQA